MSNNENNKKIPSSILIFGAAGHIGKPLTQFLSREAAQIKLRLVSSKAERVAALRDEFPQAEVVTADYYDRASLEAAVQGMQGLFINTPGGTDERAAMTSLIAAIKDAGTAVHVIRTLGMQPEANPRRVPEALRQPPALTLAIQHPIAKRLFDESNLPVTYMNFGASFMDNLFWMREGLQREHKLIWHERLIPFIDPRDIAEVAGRLLLSNNHRHIGQFHTLNNGHDLLRYSDVAALMTEVFGEKITHDGSKESFFKAYPHVAHILWEFFEYERANEVVWARNDFVERTLQRKPVTLRQWLEEHATQLLGRG